VILSVTIADDVRPVLGRVRCYRVLCWIKWMVVKMTRRLPGEPIASVVRFGD